MHVVRDSQPLILLFLFSYFGLKNFLYGQAPFCTDVSVFAENFSKSAQKLTQKKKQLLTLFLKEKERK